MRRGPGTMSRAGSARRGAPRKASSPQERREARDQAAARARSAPEQPANHRSSVRYRFRAIGPRGRVSYFENSLVWRVSIEIGPPAM